MLVTKYLFVSSFWGTHHILQGTKAQRIKNQLLRCHPNWYSKNTRSAACQHTLSRDNGGKPVHLTTIISLQMTLTGPLGNASHSALHQPADLCHARALLLAPDRQFIYDYSRLFENKCQVFSVEHNKEKSLMKKFTNCVIII